MMNKINEWINLSLIFVLVKWFKVREEFLSPLSWKVVGEFDMLKLVTKSPNVLCLKSSVAMNYRPSNYENDFPHEMHMYRDNSQLIFLFDNKISQTTNNNLRYDYDNIKGLSPNYEFKFKLKTLHSKLITKLIKRIVKLNTDKLLAIAKEFNHKNPEKKEKYTSIFVDANGVYREKDALNPKNIIYSQQYKDALEEEKIRTNNFDNKSNEIDDISIENQFKERRNFKT